ncbi:hypothetical protein [Emticicia sp. C21]|uniref:hypothetical protein n=1 Tax=Emticicia sp. C21 TaxID=2302915 RepID=UPI000E354601|nr:hypothetical protein [Emticicia sp. C21]RFS14451.1 hypothetical protein D0T08_21505 [Emticicia sp. C21]
MKRILLTFFLLGFILSGFAQSISLEANSFQLPRISENPACTVEDKGKQIFNTVQNKVLYCNGTAWISGEPAVEASVIPAFQVYNTTGKIFTASESEIDMLSKSYDLTNSANLKNIIDFPNRFIVPVKGVYNLKVYGDLELTNFTPKATTKVYIILSRETAYSSYNYSSGFPVYANDNWKHLLVSKDFNFLAGERIVVKIYMYDPPVTGTIKLNKIYFEGHLIAKQ